jgi:hypothetical protein
VSPAVIRQLSTLVTTDVSEAPELSWNRPAGCLRSARREGGPCRWEPLFYLAYALHDPAIDEGAVLTAARLLLDAGADPNAGYLWHGLPTPFTVVTGVFGEGELGPVRQPRHPHSIALARLLLQAGAVEILAGLGFDVNARGRTDAPSDQPWQTALHKAAEDGNLDLARTLLRLGADPGIRDHRFNSTPLGWARYFGHEPLIELLEPLTPPEGTDDTNAP